MLEGWNWIHEEQEQVKGSPREAGLLEYDSKLVNTYASIAIV